MGNIHKRKLVPHSQDNSTKLIRSTHSLNFTPLDLSVDWLNNHLYILGEVKQTKIWQIARCGLSGEGLMIAVAGLKKKPYNLEVDPYNGYIFFCSCMS